MKTFINELDFPRKTVIIQWNALQKKDLLLLTNKLIQKIFDPRNAKEHYKSLIRKKHKISKATGNDCLSTKLLKSHMILL